MCNCPKRRTVAIASKKKTTMIKRLCCILLLAWAATTHGQDVACTSTVPLARQHRTNVKHRAPGPAETQVQRARIAQVLVWAAPTNMDTPKSRKIDQPFPPRELKLYTTEGDLWRAKIEDNDCDFHLEVTAHGGTKTASRIIVEIPQGDPFLPAREKLIETLAANGYEISHTKPIDLEEPLRVIVTGFAFYDSAHWSTKNPKKGHGHGTKYVGTLWELHPVWKIEFPDE